jgi:hypothetical protein
MTTTSDPARHVGPGQTTNRIDDDRRSSTRLAVGLAVAVGSSAVGLAVFAYVLDRHPPKAPMAVAVGYLAVLLVLVALISPFLVVALHRARARHDSLSKAEFKSIDRAAESIGDKALGRLVSFNFRLMDRFITVALGQAKAAYIFCAGSATAALLVLLAGTTTLMMPKPLSEQITVGVLSGAGAALSGYISVTFMKTFKAASRHMEYYYGQPLVHCYLLHAEWLAERAGVHDPALTSELFRQLMDDTLGASKNAQIQLSDLLKLPRLPGRPYVADRHDQHAGNPAPNGRRRYGHDQHVAPGRTTRHDQPGPLGAEPVSG